MPEKKKNHPYVKRMDAGTRICFIKQKYRPAYDKIGIESPSIVRHMKKILKFLEEEDGRDEQEKISGLLKTSIFLFIEIQSRIRKRLTLLKLYSQIFGKK